MKKLMIALCAAVLGVAANAASVDWSFSWATYDDTSDVTTGTAAYLVLVSDYSVADATAALKKGTFDASKTLDYAAIANNGSKGSYVKATTDDLAKLAKGSAYDFYAVIVEGSDDGDLFAVVNVKNYTIPSTGTGEVKFGDLSDDEGNPFVTWQEVEKEDPEPTPEPTSAMLMLLGMAGLALRRKQK